MIKARYTIVLKTLMDDEKVKPLIDKALSTYPMYQPKHEFAYSVIPTRDELNKKILNRYKYREIGFETIGRFLDELEITMNEIMPYYNQKYKSVDIMNELENIFDNVDVTETFEEQRENETSGTSKDNQSATSKDNEKTNTTGSTSSEASSQATDNTTTTETMTTSGKNVKSDTPQSELSIVGSDIDLVKYATEVNWNKNDSSSEGISKGTSSTSSESSSESTSQATSETSSESSSETTSETSSESLGTTRHTLSKKGNQGVNTYAHDLLEFRELALNIEQEIINDPRVQELFMLIY